MIVGPYPCNIITIIIIIIVISNQFIYEESGYENATNKHSPITNYTWNCTNNKNCNPINNLVVPLSKAL